MKDKDGKEVSLEEWCQSMLAATGRDPREIMDIKVNPDGTWSMRGKPIQVPIVYRESRES